MPHWNEHLRDGTPILVRPLLPADAAAEREFLDSLASDSLRFHFLGQAGHPGDAVFYRLTQVDATCDAAFAAFASDEGEERVVGVSRYCSSADDSGCEFSVRVRADWQARGVGTMLLAHALQVAKGRGIRRVWSIDAASDTSMQALAHYFGFEHDPDLRDASRVIHSLWLD